MTDPLGLVDLTTLNEDDTAGTVRAVAAKAVTPRGPVAAVCILSRLTAVGADALQGTGVPLAVTVNFPAGDDDVDATVAETERAVADGAREIDVVVPWRTHLAGDEEAVARMVRAVAGVSPPDAVKAILETGSHPDAGVTRALADAALESGAWFVKTSSGKVGPGASPEAARVLLEAVRDHGHGGVKVSGGVRTPEQARAYVALAEEVLGEPATPRTFRIGASSLLDALLAEDEGAA